MNPNSTDILDALGYAYFEVDLKGHITHANQPFLEKCEGTLEEIRGRHYRHLVMPSQVSELFRTFSNIYETRQAERILFTFLRKRSGGYRVAEGMIGPIVSDEQVSGFRGILFDVTEHIEDKIRLESEKQSASNELAIGRRIQNSFLPSNLPSVEGWQVDARFQSAREVAGDFYDIFPISNGKRIGFVIADVCDKGVGAAMFMAIFRTLLRAFASQNFSTNLTDAISTLGTNPSSEESFLRRRTSLSTGALPLQNAIFLTNQYIARTHGDSNMFATVFFGALNPLDGNLLYINAGHEPPMILTKDGVVNRLQPTGPAVGMLENLSFDMKEIVLQPGQLFFAYTDGVVDARDNDGKSFGEERLIKEITRAAGTPESPLTTIMTALTDHMQEHDQFDDLTLLSIHRSS